MHNASDCTSSPCRRQRICVISADYYDSTGQIVIDVLSKIINSVIAGCSPGGHTGFVFSTGSTIAETVEAMRCCQVELGGFDALICSSGSEIFYPWRDLIADGDYSAHVEYRWPGEHVKSSVSLLAKVEGAAEEDDLFSEEAACNSHCYAYSVRPEAKVWKADVVRQRLRMRGFRCNLVYARACTRLNVIPLFASRAHALRLSTLS